MNELFRIIAPDWMPHLLRTLLFAGLLGASSALLDKRQGRERAYVAVWVCVTWTASVIAGSWVMYWIHG